jgi:uncharacterized protein
LPLVLKPFGLSDYSVNILGLSQKTHSFEFQLKDAFFTIYGTEIVSKGLLDAKVTLNKKETLIEANFKIEGTVQVICDRSLDNFDLALKIDSNIIFKYGEVAEEISDEIIIIPHDLDVLDVGKQMYEFIVLAIPIKKLHPRFQSENEEDEDDEGTIVYQSEKSDAEIDPRWEQLKKLK